MSHKVDPRVYRLRDISDWKARGYYKDLAGYLEEDFRIRKYLDEKIGKTGVEKVEIERFAEKINIIIYSARPGLIIGRGGEAIEQLKKDLEVKILKKPVLSAVYKNHVKLGLRKKNAQDLGDQNEPSEKKKNIKIEIREIKDPWTSAELVAQWIAQRLEKRIPFRKAIKQAMSKVLAYKEVKGVRIQASGRLNGNEIARQEWFGSGQLPRQTLRANIDYAKEEAHCTYGVIGIKVWMYKGEKFE